MTTRKPQHQADFCAPEARPWILAAAILVSALGFIDGTIISIASPAIRASLDAGLVQTLWFNNAYMLPLSALILVGGAAGDRFGVVRMILMGLALFLSASVLSTFATSAEMLLVGRALKGTGAAFMIPGSLALIARAYPRDIRGRAIGTWAAASAVTTAIGPILSGLILTYGAADAWRFIFAINMPLGGIAIWLLLSRIKTEVPRDPNPLDFPGALLATIALGTGAFALSNLGQGNIPAPALLGVSAIAVVIFLWWERRTPFPMVPFQLFRDSAFTAANIVTFTLYFSLSAVIFYLPMTVITGWDQAAIEAAAAFAPLPVFLGLLSTKIGQWADKRGTRLPITLGSIIVAVAFAAQAMTLHTHNYWGLILPLNALLGLGMAFVVGPLSTTVMTAAGDDQSGTASGINNAVSRIAGLVAVASMGALAAYAYQSAGGPLSFGVMEQSSAHILATDSGFRAILWTTAVLSAASALIAWCGLRPGDKAPGDTDATSRDPEPATPQTAPETPAAWPETKAPQ